MAEIILFPTHKDYCGKCIYSGGNGGCKSEKYIRNAYKVCCVWKRCPYRREKKT
ncbi:MAG: hypothetical protein ACLUJV_15660 [Blautia producta]